MTFRGIGIFLLLVVPVLFWYLLFNTGKDALSTSRELVKTVNAAQQNAEGDPSAQAKLPQKRAEFYASYRIPQGPPSPQQQAQFDQLWQAVAFCQTPEVAGLDGAAEPPAKDGAVCHTMIRGSGGEGEPMAITLEWVGHHRRWYLRAYQVGQSTPMPLVAAR
ncbi:MAG TPA: hypothetical protein VFU47_15950 [Armatimonadota bacterium]|nr:hypothetical protein [Armatimonadota bacterium]